MKHSLGIIVGFGLFAFMSLYYAQVFSYQIMPDALANKTHLILDSSEAGPKISALAYLVFDMDTGQVIYESNKDQVLPIASVTKLFTAAALEENFDTMSTTSITWSDVLTEGDSGKLKHQQNYSYHDLLFPLLLESSNDAATALVNATDGELLERMNKFASDKGVTNTVFSDASGLSDKNVSSASDLRSLLMSVYKKHPHILNITTLPQYVGVYTGWLNNNPVYKKSGYKGGKHGYTDSANRTMVSVFDEEVKESTFTLGYIILGSDDLKDDLDKLRSFITSSATVQ